MVDCAAILTNSNAVSDLVSACLNSRATEAAAKLTAAATTKAAWIQLGATFAILVAGAGAYCGAVRQVRLAENERKAKVAAYKSRVMEIAVNICNHALMNSFRTKSDAKIIEIEPLTVPEELKPSNWLDHALLGEKVVTAISGLYQAANRFVEFSEEMRGKPAETESKFGPEESGITTYRHLNESLNESAEKLLSLIRAL